MQPLAQAPQGQETASDRLDGGENNNAVPAQPKGGIEPGAGWDRSRAISKSSTRPSWRSSLTIP